MNQSRVPSGVPTGGQFSARTHAEADILLDRPAQPLPGWDRLLSDYPELAHLADVVSEHTPLYLVGGSVRDLAAGQNPKDLDVTSALTPEEFRKVVSDADLFDKHLTITVFDVGEAHGTTGISYLRPDGNRVEIEHTTHRVESYEEGSRTPTVGFGTSLRADLDRRDFTLNAVAVNVATGEVVDPHHGLEDLERRVLRTPLDPVRTFSEDPLRISRLVRFASTRSFHIDPDTAEAASKVADRLDIVSAERKRAELVKVFDTGPGATYRALKVAQAIGVRDQVFGGLGDLAQLVEFRALKLRGNRDVVAALTSRSTDGFAALRAMKFTNDEIASARSAVTALTDLDTVSDPAAFRAAMRRHGADALQRAARIQPNLDDRSYEASLAAVEQAIADNAGFGRKPLPVDGNDAIAAGLKGKDIGSALRAIEAEMCRDPELTADAARQMLRAVANSNGETHG